MRNIRLLLCKSLGVLLALSACAAAAADSYPTKPVRLIIPFPPGGSNDIVGRMIGAELIQMIPHVNSGRLKILGIGSLKRSPAMPNVPTIAESGVPGYDASNWWGILAPAGTPAAVVKRLNTELNAILAKPDIQKKFESQGAETLRMTPAEFGKHIRTETAKWSKVVKQAGIKAE